MRNRRQFIGDAALGLAGAAAARVAPLARQGSPPAARFRDLRRRVGIFIGPGGTIGWLATPDGTVAIDSQFPETAAVCIDGLRRRSGSAIEVLINTHHHGDHTAGNSAFRPAVRQIVQQEHCATLHRAAALSAGGDARQGVADATFVDFWSIAIGDEKVSAAYYGPAHTRGDAVVVFENARIVHMGDLVFNRIPPFVDRSSGASIRNWITVLEDVAGTHDDAMFIFGHGKDDAVTGTASDVTHFRDYLGAVLEYVQKGIAAGRSLPEIAGAETLPGFPEYVNLVKTYASPVPLFTLNHVLTAAHQELTGP